MIYVVDYGMGNLRSVEKAFEKMGSRVMITDDPSDVKIANKLVLPGVGAFGDSVKELKKRGLLEPIKEYLQLNKPFLGLCLGMQLLFEESEEAKGIKGLSIIKGKVRKFKFTDKNLKVPHMGWNSLDSIKRTSPLLKGISDGAYVYFVHSYYVDPIDKSIISSTTNYEINFASSISKGNIFAMQFHPEKSQEIGLKMLKNFVSL